MLGGATVLVGTERTDAPLAVNAAAVRKSATPNDNGEAIVRVGGRLRRVMSPCLTPTRLFASGNDGPGEPHQLIARCSGPNFCCGWWRARGVERGS
jgi:hypothetical protein